MQAVEDFDVLDVEDFFFFSTLLKVTRQGIGRFVCLALAVINLEVVTREFLSPADLLGAQTLHVHKPEEVVVVSEHKDFMSRAL